MRARDAAASALNPHVTTTTTTTTHTQEKGTPLHAQLPAPTTHALTFLALLASVTARMHRLACLHSDATQKDQDRAMHHRGGARELACCGHSTPRKRARGSHLLCIKQSAASADPGGACVCPARTPHERV